MRIKKSLAACLALIFVFLSVFEVAVIADDVAQSYRATGANFTCEYDKETSKIQIGITVTHDLFIEYKDHRIELYQIPVGKTLTDVLADPEFLPIASSEMSIKFNYAMNVTSTSDIFSKYVFVFVSELSEVSYIGSELYPSVRSEYSAANNDRSNFKGIDISNNDIGMNGAPSLAVIDVEINRLLNSNYMGYLYTVDNENIFFERSYVEYLDQRLRNLSAQNASVYLRFLIKDSDGNYVIPRDLSENTIRRIYACCDFLSDRYSSTQYGDLSGVILGEAVDKVDFDSENKEQLDKYAENFAYYAVIVGTFIRQNIADADIVFPFSDSNCYSTLQKQNGLSALLLDKICYFLDEHYADVFDFSIMLEADSTPFGISNENIGELIDLEAPCDTEYISVQNIGGFSSYLDKLGRRHKSAPKTFMYYWNVPQDLSGNALTSAYVYSYYSLSTQNKITGFIINTNGNDAFSDLLGTFRFIDTQIGKSYTSQLLPLFGKTSYSDVISPSFDITKIEKRTHILKNNLNSIPEKTLGEFYYYDYGNNTSILPWYESVGGSGLSIDYSTACGKSLKAEFDRSSDGGYTYLLCRGEYPENYIYTPYLKLNFSVEGDKNSIGGLFEVRFEVGYKGNVIETTAAVISGQRSQIILDLSDFSEKYFGEYIRISLRPLSDSSESYSFYLSSIVGVSTEYEDEELAEMIESNRLEVRNHDSNNISDGIMGNSATVLIVILLIAIILGLMLFFFLRRHDEDNREYDQ